METGNNILHFYLTDWWRHRPNCITLQCSLRWVTSCVITMQWNGIIMGIRWVLKIKV